jgi:4-hydroxy-tetrahydrodipicolinate synthase
MQTLIWDNNILIISRRIEMREFKGICVAMVTPFNKDGSVNYEAEKKLVKHFIGKGVHGILASGGTGEFTMMNIEERKKVIATAIEAAKGSGVYIIAGITANTTKDTVELAKFAGEAGADYVLALPPFAIPVTREATMKHFEEIKKNTTAGLMLYHFPGESGVTFSAEEIIEMNRSGLISAVKNTTGMDHTMEVILENGHNPSLKITNGFDANAISALACGCDGLLNAGSNMTPAQYVKIYDLMKEKKYDEAMKVYEAILPLLLFQEKNGNTEPGLCKYVLGLQGIDCGTARKPVPEVSEESKEAVKKLLAKAESVL